MKQLVLPYAIYIIGPARQVFAYIAELCAGQRGTLKDSIQKRLN